MYCDNRSRYQSRHAQEIADSAGGLYDKFVGFVEDLQKVQDQFRRTQDTFDGAFNKLSTGKGNIISRIQKLKKLGVKSKKRIAGELAERAGEEGGEK